VSLDQTTEQPPSAGGFCRLRRWAAVLCLALGLTGGCAGFWLWHVYTAPGPLTTEQLIYFPPGSGSRAIVDTLRKTGVVPASLPFVLLETLQGHTTRYKAGEYRFPPHISPQQASTLLRSGKTVQRRLALIEGQTVADFQAVAATAPGLTGDWPDSLPEGSLLAETWFYQWGDSRADLVARMQTALRAELDRLWQDRAPDLPLKTPEEALVLASIVEKETGRPDERGRVASVFLNRLRKGMPLQSDPTVIYGLTGGKGVLTRRLLRADWKAAHPHNTYQIPGLPPTPIANPGRAALRAVLQPPETDFLFFVADGTGGHVFARTLAEHNRNVGALQKIRQANRKAESAAPPAQAPD
jgi:UPF0755 protein